MIKREEDEEFVLNTNSNNRKVFPIFFLSLPPFFSFLNCSPPREINRIKQQQLTLSFVFFS